MWFLQWTGPLFRCHLGRAWEAPALCTRMDWEEALAFWSSQGHHHKASREPLNPLAAPFVEHVAREDSELHLRKQPLCSLPPSKGPAMGGLCSCRDL